MAAKKVKKVLILRSCDKDMKGHGGFQWPTSGWVSCPDWNPKPECGGGLHGLLWGEGDYGLMNNDSNNWLVFEADADKVVDIQGKVKVPEAVVVFHGDPWKAVAWLNDEMRRRKVNFKGAHSKAEMKTSRKRCQGITATGYLGSASATGDLGSASATGDRGSASATGYRGSASATGYRGSASATGDRGSASATGYRGSAYMRGLAGKAMSGKDGVLIVSEWDGKRIRVVVGYVGEGGIEEKTWYNAKAGKLVKAS